jgi:hypothetical protein
LEPLGRSELSVLVTFTDYQRALKERPRRREVALVLKQEVSLGIRLVWVGMLPSGL